MYTALTMALYYAIEHDNCCTYHSRPEPKNDNIFLALDIIKPNCIFVKMYIYYLAMYCITKKS